MSDHDEPTNNVPADNSSETQANQWGDYPSAEAQAAKLREYEASNKASDERVALIRKDWNISLERPKDWISLEERMDIEGHPIPGLPNGGLMNVRLNAPVKEPKPFDAQRFREFALREGRKMGLNEEELAIIAGADEETLKIVDNYRRAKMMRLQVVPNFITTYTQKRAEAEVREAEELAKYRAQPWFIQREQQRDREQQQDFNTITVLGKGYFDENGQFVPEPKDK